MSDYGNARRSKPRRKMVLWPYAVGVVLALAWAVLTLPAFIQGVAPYMNPQGVSSGRMFGYFAGHAFLQALGVWILLNLPFIKWQGPHPLYFFALLAAAAAPEVASIKAAEAKGAEYRYDQTATQTGKAEIISVLWSVVKFGPQKESALDAKAKAAGEAGLVDAAWKRLAAGLAQDARLIQGQSAALISASGPLAPANLAGTGLAAAKARVAQAHKAMDLATSRTEARFRTYRADIARIAAGSADKPKVELLAERGRLTKQHFDDLWKVERAILAESDSIVANPASARGREPKIETLTAQEMEKQDNFRRETSSAADEPDDGES